ncbi:MAG: WG repeat-containing protein [Paludibacteraceae bacterium]|nr:WG repeat-containing protein [Paludibacteraceae bacterium]
MKNKGLILLALLSGTCMDAFSADIQDAIKQVKKNNFAKAITIQDKLMGSDLSVDLLGNISKVMMLNNPKYSNYSPLDAYGLYNKIMYSDRLYDSKVMNVMREEGIDMDKLRMEIESNLLKDAKSQNTIEAYDAIINACQGCSYMAEAKKAKDDLVFNNTLSGATLADVVAFINNEPNSPKRAEAERLRDSLAYNDLQKSSDAYTKYINDYPNSRFTPKLKKEVEKLAYEETKSEATINAYAKYIANFPESKNVKDFQSEIEKEQSTLVWKIDPKYTDARYVTDSITKKDYIFVKQSVWGVLNSTGAEIVSPKFEDVDAVYNGLATVKVGGRWGIANVENGEVTYPCNMVNKTDIKFLAGNYAAIKENGAWGLVYKGKDVVVPPFLQGSLNNRSCKELEKGGVALTDGHYLKTASGEGVVAHDSIYDEVSWSLTSGIDSRFIKVRSGKKYGIVGPEGKLMFAPQFDMIPFFDSDGIAILKNLFQEGWIDTTGHFLYYDRLSSYKDCGSDKMIAYEVNGKWGFIDKSQKGGDIALRFDALGECFNDGFAKVKENGQWKYIDRVGNTLYTIKGNETTEVVDGVLVVRDGKNIKLVSKQGTAFDVVGIDDFDKHISSNYIVAKKDGLKGAVDRAGREVVPFSFTEMTRFCNDYSIVTREGKMGLFYKNNMVVDTKYERLQDPAYVFTNDCNAFADGKVNNTIFISVANGTESEKWVIKEGKVLFKTVDEVKLVKPVDGYAVVKTAAYGSFNTNAKCALIGPKGEVLVKPSYSDIDYLKADKNLYFTYKTADGKWGILNSRGSIEVPAFANKIYSYDGTTVFAEVDGDNQMFDKFGLPMLPKGFDVDGLIVKDKSTGKSGVVDKKGNIKVYPYYDKVVKVTDKYAIVSKNGLFGIVNYR